MISNAPIVSSSSPRTVETGRPVRETDTLSGFRERSPDSKAGYRSDIDGLRAIAVLSVVSYHSFARWIRGGFVGVDIFFVISGYLISSIIYKELESDRFSIVEFYVRRIRRIYPALFIVLASVCLAGWLLLLPTAFVLLGKQIIGGSTFAANFVLWWQSGYFSPDATQKPLLHLWSLGVEEQFYLIFPVICIASYHARSRWKLPVTFLAIGVVSIVLNVTLVSKYSGAAFFLPFSRLWELLVGAGLSLCLHRELQISRESRLLAKRRTLVGFLGLGLLVASIFGIDQNCSFPGWWAFPPTVGAALVIAAGQSSWVNRHILSCRPAAFVGLISYPLYLWHWPILSFTRIATNVSDHDISKTSKSAIIVVSFVLAYLTYRFIELPIRHTKLRDRRRNGALWLLGCVSVTGVFGVLVVKKGGFPARLPTTIVALDHDYGADASLADREGTCFLRSDQSASSFTRDCLDSVEGHTGQPLVFLWGDSHAADLFPGFRALQRQSGVRLAQYTSSLCAPILGLKVRTRPACLSVNSAVIQFIRILKPDVVVLSALWDYSDPDHDRATRAEKLRRTIELVKAAGVQRVVVIGSAPSWTSTVPSLLIDEIRHRPNTPVPDRLTRGLLGTHDDALLSETTQKAGGYFVPLINNLCDPTSCIVTTGPSWTDVITYDNAHFTEHGSIMVAQRIWPSIIHAGELNGP
jgi:peptidoglycan/LPS O-acetylase OafA/YrhL